MPPEERMLEVVADTTGESQNTAPLTQEGSTAESQGNSSEQTEQMPETPAAKNFTQEDVDKIVQKRLAKERGRIERLANAEAENRVLREQLQKGQPKPEVNAEPAPEQFKTYEEYIVALTDWKVEQKLAARDEKSAKTQRQSEDPVASNIQKRLEEGAAKYDDFDEVVRDPNVPIMQAMAEAIGESEIGADIAYHLGSNVAEARRIAALTPAGQVRAIVQLEAKLKVTAAPVVSKAPKPIEPITSPKTPTTGLSDDLSADEWAKRRNAEVAARRR